MTKVVLFFIFFASWLNAGHQDLGLKSEFAFADKLEEATHMDDYGTNRCMCGDYGSYPLLFPGNELIVAFPIDDQKDEKLFHIWNPSGFKKICGGPCGRSHADGRRFYYIASKYLNHEFEIYEARNKKSSLQALFEAKKGLPEKDEIVMTTFNGNFSYKLNYESVDNLIYELRIDMFVKYIVEPLLETFKIKPYGWSFRLHSKSDIAFKTAERTTYLWLDAPVKAHDLIKIIDQHLQEKHGFSTLVKTLSHITFEDFNAPHNIVSLNKPEIMKIINSYLEILKSLIPEEDFESYIDEDITKLQYVTNI